jgi:hypothetical protein
MEPKSRRAPLLVGSSHGNVTADSRTSPRTRDGWRCAMAIAVGPAAENPMTWQCEKPSASISSASASAAFCADWPTQTGVES